MTGNNSVLDISAPTISGLAPNVASWRPAASAPGVSDDFYRTMLEAIGDMIIRYDAKSRRIYASPSFANGLGYSSDEMLSLQPSDLIHPDDIPHAEANFLTLGPTHPKVQVTLRLRRKDGAYIWAENRYYYLPADDGAMVIIRDITESKLAEDALTSSKGKLEAANMLLREQAQIDALTNLANRRLFEERLIEEYRTAASNAGPLGLIMLDVDCFKSYNDLYGHQAGDEALRRVSHAVQQTLRRSRELAARYGGEEIVVLLPGSDTHGAFLMAERIREAVLALGIEHLGSPLGCLTVSGGASANMPTLGQNDTAALVSAADRALYAAKADGRNRVQAGEVAVSAPLYPRAFLPKSRLIPTPSQPALEVLRLRPERGPDANIAP